MLKSIYTILIMYTIRNTQVRGVILYQIFTMITDEQTVPYFGC